MLLNREDTIKDRDYRETIADVLNYVRPFFWILLEGANFKRGRGRQFTSVRGEEREQSQPFAYRISGETLPLGFDLMRGK